MILKLDGPYCANCIRFEHNFQLFTQLAYFLWTLKWRKAASCWHTTIYSSDIFMQLNLVSWFFGRENRLCLIMQHFTLVKSTMKKPLDFLSELADSCWSHKQLKGYSVSKTECYLGVASDISGVKGFIIQGLASLRTNIPKGVQWCTKKLVLKCFHFTKR